MSDYGAKNIKHLETREAMRTRIPTYLGSDDTNGIYQSLKEIVNNSTDEALAGYGKNIYILVNEETNEITVRDEGRGVPYSTENGQNVLVSIYTESHTGGKFDKGAYKNSSGLNGLGGTAVCMSSSLFIVKSQRDGAIAMAVFKEGILEEYSETPYADTATGTTVTFIPDPKVFKNMTEGYSYKRICDEIKNISYLNKGVHFFVENSDGTKSEFYSENGIGDFITDHSTNALMKAPIISTKSDKVDSVEIAFMWTNSKEEKSYVFVNGLYCSQGGSPITGAKTALSTKMKSFCGTKIEPELIRKGLVYVINCKVSEPSFTNQTKQSITNPNLRTLANEAFKEGLEEFSHTPEFSTIIELIKRYQTAEKAADRERQKILNMGKEIEKETQKKSMLMGKLKDCRKHDESSSLYIVEGDSALGPFVSCRDSTHTAAMPIRGKIINALKHPLDEVLDNEEVKAISKVCGCGILDKVNLSKFRYGKVCFAADSDPDGYAIVCLLLVLFYVLMPDLIRAGKVYWAKFPLYEVTVGKKTHLVYDDEELAAILKEHPRAAVERNKGLGEISTEAFGEAAFGENARLVRFTMEDVAAARDMLEMLLGNENKKRTEYIFSHVDFKVVEGE